MNNVLFKKMYLVVGSIFLIGLGCISHVPSYRAGQIDIIEIAHSPLRWTGVAISKAGRIFVNYSRWSDDVPFAVAEVSEGHIRHYLDEGWHYWEPTEPPENHFVWAQSVYVDRDDYLWILDAGNYRFRGVIPNAPKLVRVDLKSNTIDQKIYFPKSVLLKQSYLNDVRIDTADNMAYITDSGEGALIVVDLTSGNIRRVLSRHSSTKSEDIAVVIDGKEWRLADGTVPQVHANGIALDTENNYLYYKALTGNSLYRIKTDYVCDDSLTEEELGTKVEYVTSVGVSDGMVWGPGGNLYITDLTRKAIIRFDPNQNKVEQMVADDLLSWPDSIAVGRDNILYVTSSRMHEENQRKEPYRLFMLNPRK